MADKCKRGFKNVDGKCIKSKGGFTFFRRRGPFFNTIAIISLFLFIVIALGSFTSIDLSSWIVGISLIIAGAGFIFVGQITSINKWIKDGVQKGEISFVITIVLGLMAVVIGILALPVVGVISQTSSQAIGLISLIAIVYIILLSWVFK